MSDATALEILAWGLVVGGLARLVRWYVGHRCRCCRWRLAQPHMYRCRRCWARVEAASRSHAPAPAELLRETNPQFLSRVFTPAERYALGLEIDELLAGVRIRGEVDGR